MAIYDYYLSKIVCLPISQFIKDMYRNNRHQDIYRINKRNYGYRQEAQLQQDSPYYNNHYGHYQNRNTKKQGNGLLHNNSKPDKFSSEYLRNLVQPLKKPEKQKKEDYKIDNAKNQPVPIKQSIPRGGKIYLSQYEQQKKILDQQIQEYKNEKSKHNYLLSQNIRKTSTNNRNCDDSDWDIDKQEIRNEQSQQISSLSFSLDIPPLQIKNQLQISEQIKEQEKKEIYEIQEEDIKYIKQVEQQPNHMKKDEKDTYEIKNVRIFKVVSQENEEESEKTNMQENKQREQKNTKLQNKVKNVKETNILSFDQQNEDKKVNDYAFIKKKVQYQKQQVKEFVKLIDAIDFDSQQQKDHFEKQQAKKENKSKGKQQQQQDKINKNEEIILKLQQSHKKAKVLLTFQAISNIQSFTIKEVQLTQLELFLKLDSNGRPKLKQSYNITFNQLDKYIKFMKTSHYFPKIGHFQYQGQHFVDVAENRELIQDQTNRIEFQFCQIKVSDSFSMEQNQKSRSLIGVTIISLLCMICGSKNQVVVFQNDMSVVCSCKGNDCSEKLQGKISKVKTKIVEQ